MSVVFGNLVGDDSVTNAKTIEVTLTEDIPGGTDTVSEGLIIYAVLEIENTVGGATFDATILPTIIPPEGPPLMPVVYDQAVQDNPYCNIPNQINQPDLEGMSWWVTLNTRTQSPFFADPTVGNRHELCAAGGWFYQVLHPLAMGDMVTIDYTHIPYDIKFLAVHLHHVSGFRATETFGPFYQVPQPGGSGYTGAAFAVNGSAFPLCSFNLPLFTGSPPRFGKVVFVQGFTAQQEPYLPPADFADPFNWTGAGGAFSSPLAETGGFYGSMYLGDTNQVDWRTGYSWFDCGGSTFDGNICIDHPTLDDIGAAFSVAHSQDGISRAYEFCPLPAHINVSFGLGR